MKPLNEHDPDEMPWYFWAALFLAVLALIGAVAWSGVAR
jgi:hypothetical protein